MYSHISKSSATMVWLLLIGFCLSCSEKKDSKTDTSDVASQTDRIGLAAGKAAAVLPRIIAGYNVTKPSRLASDYDLGYTLFVVSAKGVLLTEDAPTEYDYRVIWNATYLEDFSDSGAVVEFGDVVNLNSVADTIGLGRIMISSRPGALVEAPIVVQDEAVAEFPVRISCETLLVDSSGIVCALGFSSNP